MLLVNCVPTTEWLAVTGCKPSEVNWKLKVILNHIYFDVHPIKPDKELLGDRKLGPAASLTEKFSRLSETAHS